MLRARQKIGKYRILGRIASGPLADVYRAYDSIQKQRVALKIPKQDHHTGHEEFLHEVQVATRLRHPNILSVLNASYIDDHFVIAMELGEESLADRIERRISMSRALELGGQAIAGLAHAHEHRIIHCDIKPENYILFPGNQLKLCDFGFAKISLRTIKASGSGTIDYIAPEQAMGRPKFQSDVFSLGLVLYRLFSGESFRSGHSTGRCRVTTRLASRVRPELVEILKKAIQLDPKPVATSDDRADAVRLRATAESRASPETLACAQRPQGGRRCGVTCSGGEFQRKFRRVTRYPPSMPALRRPGVREHAGMPLVRDRQSGTWFPVVDAVELSTLRARREKRLGLLPVVLRSGFCRGNRPPLSGQTLFGALQQQTLSRRADAVHALLSMVSHQGTSNHGSCRAAAIDARPAAGASPRSSGTSVPGAANPSNAVSGTQGANRFAEPDRRSARARRGFRAGHAERGCRRRLHGCVYGAGPRQGNRKRGHRSRSFPTGRMRWCSSLRMGRAACRAGKRASLTAVTTLVESLAVAMSETMLLRTAILNGIEAANEAVINLGNGSATTFTVVTIEGTLARSYQIGDSEAMIVGQRGRVRLQTTAHSPTGFAVEAGFLDEREALHHAERHLVSNFLGTADMRIDVGAPVELQLRDTVLLASDGLTDNVHVDEIIEFIRKGPLDVAANGVVRLAGKRMASNNTRDPSKPDDLSVILYRKPRTRRGSSREERSKT